MEYLREKFGVGSIAENKVDGRYAFLSSVMHKEETPHCHERVTFNIGGTIFQTCRTTLENPKRHVAKLQDTHYLQQHWDPEHEEYFFDRDPAIFRSVLNYIRRGVLHLPSNMCSPQVTAELVFWGLPRVDIEPCCWKEYNMGVQALKNLRNLERDRKPAYILNRHFDEREYGNAWDRFRAAVWRILSDPSSSKLAKVYQVLLMVLMSFCLTLFVYNTTKDFYEFLDTRVNTIIRLIDAVCLLTCFVDGLLYSLSSPNKSSLLTIRDVANLMTILPEMIYMGVVLTERGLDFEANNNHDILSIFRSVRLVRVFRLVETAGSTSVIMYTLRASAGGFCVVLALMIILAILISSLMYSVETKKDFNSIPAACWYAIVTLTTVGYGDSQPDTLPGKLIGGFAMFIGVLVLGFTLQTMATNFSNCNTSNKFLIHKEEAYTAKVNEASTILRVILRFSDQSAFEPSSFNNSKLV